MQADYIYVHNTKNELIDISCAETLRYMGATRCKHQSPEDLAKKAIDEIRGCISPRGCFMLNGIKCESGRVDFSDFCVESVKLARNLNGCRYGAVFALTIGHECDRRISKYLKTSPSYSLALNAAATAAIEGYAGMFVREISSELSSDGLYVRPRFSPGYGDFPIQHQKDILQMLDAGRRIGLSLTDNLMILPAKSITAVMGICDTDSACTHDGCEVCTQKDCLFRRNI